MTSLSLNDVSRETLQRIETFEGLIEKWTKKINLIAPSTISTIRERHVQDSVQIYGLAPKNPQSWLDLGSGGGLPGIVCAILAKEFSPHTKFTLVESDQRKCAFLRTAIRELDLNAEVKSVRIEALKDVQADVLTARALADLTVLLGFAERLLPESGLAIFPKGAKWDSEVTEARKQWQFDLETVTSKTHPEARILKISGVSRV